MTKKTDKRTKEEKLSYNMSRIKCKDSKIELVLRRALYQRWIQYRKNYLKIPGKLDIAFPGIKIAVFCDSEFQHGKDWSTDFSSKFNKSAAFWSKKNENNKKKKK